MPTPSLEQPPKSAPPSSVLPPCAVLIDGSALFLASSSRSPEGRRLNYFGLIDLLVSNIEGLRPPSPEGDSVWSMWTSADPGNAGQSKFLDFAANRLRWQIRATHPSQAFMIEPDALFPTGTDSLRAGRLVRFDAAIAFAMGRLAHSHRIVVISDSFALRDPMIRVNEYWSHENGRCTRAFFGQMSDPRWRTARSHEFDAKFLDLDDYQYELLGAEQRTEMPRPVQQPGQPVF